MTPEVPGSALQGLAVFPLPNVVLFPGAVLPLHVFESRYRDMTRDVLVSSRLLAIARLRPGFEQDDTGRPPMFSTAGIGYVIGSDELPDGRYNLLVRGVGRVSVDVELPPDRSYRRVLARRLIDSRSDRPEELAVMHKQLVALCDRLAEHLTEGADQLRQLVHSDGAPGGCADLLSAALVTDPDERQSILEMLDPADRVGCVVDHLARFLATVRGARPQMPN